MTIRKFALAAGAAALLSTQAAYAAPVVTYPAADPLVALSVLASTQSRAAVCAPGTSAAAAGVATASQVVAPPGCVLPVTTPPPPAPVAQPLPPPLPPAPGKSVQPLLMTLIALAAIVALAVLIEPDDDEDLPISPA